MEARCKTQLPVAIAISSLKTPAIIAWERRKELLKESGREFRRTPTMSVLVIKLAIPNPWGNRSNQRWICEDSRFQNTTKVLAITVKKEDASVKV